MSAPKARRGTLGKVLRYVLRHAPLMLASVLFAAVSVACTLSIPILTGQAVDCILGPAQVDFPRVLRLLLLIAAIAGLGGFSQWLMNDCNNRAAYRVVRDVRRDAFEKLATLPLSFLDSRPSGEIVSRIIADVDQFADGLLMGFTQLFTGVLTILGTLLFMLSVHPLITLVVVLVTPVSLFVAGFIAKRTYDLFRVQSAARGEQTAFLEEMLSGQKVVQAFGRTAQTQQRFDALNETLRGASLRATFFSSITNPSTRFVNSLVYTGVGIVGALTVLSGGLTVGQLSAFLSYANQYTKPFNEISGVMTELQNALACADRVFDLLAQSPEPPDAPDALDLGRAAGRVDVTDVAFSYRPDRPLLRDFSLQVPPGSRVALVGPTGCGKTTVINLLMRFYDVQSGSIALDGADLRRIRRRSLRDNYGMVLQETWLKAGTVAENIAYGDPAATREQIVAAAKAAHAHSFITRLPQGYDTFLGEDGGSLSQGQKQLLCIARVMLRLPPMLILDEATSSIDTRTEMRIQRAFARLMQGRTCFIVAHRLSTVRDADTILVMRDGQIVEQGRHEELLARGGFYAQIYNSPFADPPPPD